MVPPDDNILVGIRGVIWPWNVVQMTKKARKVSLNTSWGFSAVWDSLQVLEDSQKNNKELIKLRGKIIEMFQKIILSMTTQFSQFKAGETGIGSVLIIYRRQHATSESQRIRGGTRSVKHSSLGACHPVWLKYDASDIRYAYFPWWGHGGLGYIYRYFHVKKIQTANAQKEMNFMESSRLPWFSWTEDRYPFWHWCKFSSAMVLMERRSLSILALVQFGCALSANDMHRSSI